MRTIPQMWYVLKMCLIGFVVIAISFMISYLINNQVHQFWFTILDQKIIVSITSWTVINIGAIGLFIVITFYAFRIGMYYYRKYKTKKKL